MAREGSVYKGLNMKKIVFIFLLILIGCSQSISKKEKCLCLCEHEDSISNSIVHSDYNQFQKMNK
jgi:hypothetical protein